MKPRKPIRHTKPKAPGGLCWNCDKPLYAGGRSYVQQEIDGVMRPVHKRCDHPIEVR